VGIFPLHFKHISLNSWASAEMFSGREKYFRGGGVGEKLVSLTHGTGTRLTKALKTKIELLKVSIV